MKTTAEGPRTASGCYEKPVRDETRQDRLSAMENSSLWYDFEVVDGVGEALIATKALGVAYSAHLRATTVFRLV